MIGNHTLIRGEGQVKMSQFLSQHFHYIYHHDLAQATLLPPIEQSVTHLLHVAGMPVRCLPDQLADVVEDVVWSRLTNQGGRGFVGEGAELVIVRVAQVREKGECGTVNCQDQVKRLVPLAEVMQTVQKRFGNWFPAGGTDQHVSPAFSSSGRMRLSSRE
jgi:hypothetical protein